MNIAFKKIISIKNLASTSTLTLDLTEGTATTTVNNQVITFAKDGKPISCSYFNIQALTDMVVEFNGDSEQIVYLGEGFIFNVNGGMLLTSMKIASSGSKFSFVGTNQDGVMYV